MKKLPVILILIFTSFTLWAQNRNSADSWEPHYTNDWEEETEPEQERFRLKNRMVELSLANVALDMTLLNDVLKNPFTILFNIKEFKKNPDFIWQDPIVVDLDNLLDNFQFYADARVKPLSLNFNRNDNWGIGLDIGHVSASGILTLSENLFSLRRTNKDLFGVGAAIFADAGIPVFFHAKDFKIKFRPAVYLPLAYTEPGVTYSFKRIVGENGNEGLLLEAAVDMRVYTAVSLAGNVDSVMQDFRDNFWYMLRKNAGYDFELGVEYPLSDALDIGIDIVNIPVPYASARLYHYLQVSGEAYVDTSYLNIADLLDKKGFPEEAYNYDPDNVNDIAKTAYHSGGREIRRPLTMLFYGNLHPGESEILSFIPSLGFSVNRMYARPGAVEGGLSARVDLANMFITTLGINYNDRKWRNSIDLALNFRAVEFDIGLSLQSTSFRKSWRSAGMGINAGIKMGW